MEDHEAQQERTLFLENIRDTLRTPHGFVVIQELLEAARLFAAPDPNPAEHRLRAFFHEFFTEIEEADPAAALRLFAQCRGLPYIRNQ